MNMWMPCKVFMSNERKMINGEINHANDDYCSTDITEMENIIKQ